MRDQFVEQAAPDAQAFGSVFDGEQEPVVGTHGNVDDLVLPILVSDLLAGGECGELASRGTSGVAE